MHKKEGNVIAINNLFQHYKSRNIILKDVTLKVKKGSIHGLLGRNGAGKTTLIKTIIGALPIKKGEILINGKRLTQIKHSVISYMPEKMLFPKGMNALKFVTYLGYLVNGSLAKTKIKAQKLFAKYNIKYLMKKKPNHISSGQRKKIMLMQALINDAEILILDEPSANLDPVASQELINIISDLNKQGMTIILSTHDLLLFSHLFNTISVLDEGKILYHGAKKEFIGSEKNLHQAYIRKTTHEAKP